MPDKVFDIKKAKSEFRGSILDWNIRFPFDFVWRKKYNIPFGSEQHLNMNFLDMKFDLEEEQMFAILSDNNANKSDKNQALKNFLDGLSRQDVEQEMQKAFDSIDINEINKTLQNGRKDN